MGKNYFLTNSPLVSTGKQKKFSRQRAVVEWLLQAPQNIQFVLSPCYNRYNRPDDFIFVEANEAAGAMMGKNLDELIGQKLIELLNINPFHSFFQNYLRAFLYHTPLEESIEFPLLARKGKKITHRAEVVNDVLVVVVKVESLPQAKQPQKESETQLQDALAQAEKREKDTRKPQVYSKTTVESTSEEQTIVEEKMPITVENEETSTLEASVETQTVVEEKTPITVENEETSTLEASVETQTVVEEEKATIAKHEDFVLATPELEREEAQVASTKKREEPLVLVTPELEKEEQHKPQEELVLSTPEFETEETIVIVDLEQVATINPTAIKALKRNKVSQQVSLTGKIEYTNQKLAKTLELKNTNQSDIFVQDILHKVSRLPYQLALVKAQSGHNVTDLPLIFRTQSGKYVKVNALIKPQINNGEVESIHHFFKVMHNTPNFNEVSSFGKVASFNAF